MQSQTLPVEQQNLSNLMSYVGSKIYLNIHALLIGDPLRRTTFNVVAAGYSNKRSVSGSKRSRANCKDGARLVGFEVSNYVVRLTRRAGKEFRRKGANYRIH